MSTALYAATCACTPQRAAVIAAYQAQLAAEAAAAGDGSDPQPTAGNKGSKQAGAGGGGGGSKVATPRHMSRLSMGEVQQLPPDVKLPEYGGFAAYFVDAGGYFEVVTGHKRNA